MSEADDQVQDNRAYWSVLAADYAGPGRLAWAAEDPTWGMWGIPERELHLLPDVDGRDVVELGCGTAYVSAWIARRGGHVTGIDNSPTQLATACSLQQEFGLTFPLLWADAERAPFASDSFDIAISEYGAALWCDPDRWIPEAARLLRLGGRLVFVTNSPMLVICSPDDETGSIGRELLRPYFGMHRVQWTGEAGVEYHLPHGEWIRLLRMHGFEVEKLDELQPSETASTRYQYLDLEWSQQWPSEEAWTARKL